MNVELISYTELGEKACGVAAKTCVASDMPSMDDDNSKSLMHALSSGHDSIAEHMTFTFAIEGISRACSHQLVRHRVASYSQQSQRYVKMDGFDYVVPESIKNHEKTWDEDGKTDVAKWFANAMEGLSEIYARLVSEGIPDEDARYVLPNACKTNIVVTMNARSLMNFFKYRLCNRAQWEIKQVAEMMLALVKEVAPSIFENAGARCKATGICPEKRSCGKCPKLETLQERNIIN